MADSDSDDEPRKNRRVAPRSAPSASSSRLAPRSAPSRSASASAPAQEAPAQEAPKKVDEEDEWTVVGEKKPRRRAPPKRY